MKSFEKRYEKIPVNILCDAKDASVLVARQIASLIRHNNNSGHPTVLGLSVGASPILIYEEFVAMHQKEGLSFENTIFFTTEEFFPMKKNDLQSRYNFLQEYLFAHINVKKENIHYLDGGLLKNEVHAFCQNFDAELEKLGGLDFLLLSDNTLGANEPGTPYNSGTRLITLNFTSRIDAASEFYGVENVPSHALTMGIKAMLSARQIVVLAWGESAAKGVKRSIEGNIDEQHITSYLQQHKNTTYYVDEPAAAELTRIKTPWLTGSCEWNNPRLVRKAVFWLCTKLNKPILKLTDRDYNDNGMSDLVTEQGPSNKINIRVFNELQHTITGWPGGKPNADDSTRPERATPFPKRVVVFSPHPDDDVISMGGTLARLSEHGHEVHVAYQVSGNIAVFDHDVIRFLDFVRDNAKINGLDVKKAEATYQRIVNILKNKKSGEVDVLEVQQIKGAIRRGEAKAACRYIHIPEERIHFLDMPFYETGTIKKKPIGKDDISVISNLLNTVKPHQIFAAGDLSDPHGTHRVCFQGILDTLKLLKHEAWVSDCRFWLYRGAWQEWDVAEVDMAVPLSPEEVKMKREAIFKHQSQKDRPLFPGSDAREFWVRAEERNHGTAIIYDKLGMAEYQAIELFVRYNI